MRGCLKGKALNNHQAASLAPIVYATSEQEKGYLKLVQYEQVYLYTRSTSEQLLRCNHDNYDCTWIVLNTEKSESSRWACHFVVGSSFWFLEKATQEKSSSLFWKIIAKIKLKITWKMMLWSRKLYSQRIFYIIEDTKDGRVNVSSNWMYVTVGTLVKFLEGWEEDIVSSRKFEDYYQALKYKAENGWRVECTLSVIRKSSGSHTIFGIPKSKSGVRTAVMMCAKKFFHSPLVL